LIVYGLGKWTMRCTCTTLRRAPSQCIVPGRRWARRAGRWLVPKPPNDAGTTARYFKATLEEVATALAALTGEPHPLALPTDGDS